MTREVYLDEDDLPESVNSVDDPVVVERAQLEELRSAAEDDSEDQFEELQDELSGLNEIREEKESLEEEVEELQDRIEELEEQNAEVEEVKEMYAEELTEETPFEAEELMDFDLDTLREKHDALEEEDVTDTDPDPQGDNPSEEELEDEPEEEEDVEVEELEEKLEFYESRGWTSPAESVREELEAVRGD